MPRFIPNRGFERQMEREIRFIGGLKEAADEAAEAAKAIAPVDERDYQNGIDTVVEDKEVYLVGKDWKSNFIEFGTVDTPIFAPLRRGARAVGLRLRGK